MAEKVLGPQGSKRRKRFLWIPALLVACLALFVVAGAQAVHDLQFQLDGDTTSTAYSPPAGLSSPSYDWNDIFSPSDSGGVETISTNSSLVGSGKVFSGANFVRDFESGSGCTLNSTSTTFCTGDDTTYATGSKDTLGIGNGGWQCNHDNNVNSKIDIMNAYVLSYTNPANGHKIFYFGLDKNKDNGTNDVGFWFLQNGAACSAPSGHLNFQGAHQDGDTLVVSEFTGGGGVSTIKAFRWAAAATGPLAGDGGCIDSNDNPNPKAGGCDGLPIATGADCKTSGGGDALCATTNASCTTAGQPCSLPFKGNVTTPWLTADATLGVGHTVVPPDFFEGGIDITKAFQGKGGTAPSCFTTIVPDTRSSATPTATLFDYVLNQIGGCQSGLTTQENAAASTPIGANGTVSSGTDSATLSISGTQVWGGTLSFYLCGPNVTSCDVHGVKVSKQTVASTDASNTYTSSTATLTSAAGSGEYCWHAHFEPDAASAAAGVKPADDNGSNECFVITPLTPKLSTQASGPVALGGTISDTASLTGTANNPNNDGAGGDTGLYKSINGTTKAADTTIAWTLYGPAADGSGQCTTAIGAPTGSPVTVSGDNTSYGPVSYTTNHAGDTAGKYTFAASYGGDGPNTLAASGVSCDATGANNEQVTVSTSSIKTTPNLGANGSTSITTLGSVNVTDSATVTVTGASTWSGTVKFFLCGPDVLATQTNCNTGGVAIGATENVSNGSATVSSDPAAVTKVGNYCWRGVFTSGTTGVPNSSDPSDATSTTECFSITPVTPKLTTQVVNASVVLGNPIQDNATLSGTAPEPGTPIINPTTAGSAAGGTINWTVYGPNSCTTVAKTGLSRTVLGDNTYGPVSFTPTAIGVYVFVASYTGDSPNTNGVAATDCASQPDTEKVTVTGNAGESSVQNWLPNDTVKLTGDANLNGQLEITLYPGGSCSAGGTVLPAIPTFAITVSNAPSGSTFSTTNTTFTVSTTPTSTWSWFVHYHDNVLTSPSDSCTEVTTLNIAN
jgi:hypothetical protein